MMVMDFTVLSIYLGLNVVIGFTVIAAERKGEAPPYYWLKPVIYLSIAWAPLIHTVTAFLYAGLPGRHLWLTAIMAARFLASAFAAGPALLIVLYLILTRATKWTAGDKPLTKIAEIVTYAMIINMFMLGLELFTSFYSGIPGHAHSLTYMFAGLEGKTFMMPFMWTSVVLGLGSILMLLIPAVRKNVKLLAVACVGVFLSCWLEKGLALVVAGFIPNPLEHVNEYVPTIPELGISAGIFAMGALIITLLYKMVAGVREEAEL
jgi:molybdopterin-containing oxidoreductase family membrane subunit